MISPVVPILMARIFGFLGQSLESLNERDEVARYIMHSEGVSWDEAEKRAAHLRRDLLSSDRPEDGLDHVRKAQADPRARRSGEVTIPYRTPQEVREGGEELNLGDIFGVLFGATVIGVFLWFCWAVSHS